jgi:hypothetical protein
MPLVHAPTWTLEGKPQILLTAMRAAGALYARTPRAASFIVQTLHGVRQTLLADLVSLEGALRFTSLTGRQGASCERLV